MGGPIALIVLIAAAFLVNAMLRRQNATRLQTGPMLLLVGLAIGPMMLGLFASDELGIVRPAMQVAVCWLGLLFGLRVRRAAVVRSPARSAVALLLETALTAVGIALGLRACVPRLAVLPFRGLPGSVFDPTVAASLAIALSIEPLPLLLGLLASPSAPGMIAWARDRLSAKGPLVDALGGLASRDSWVPLLGLGLLCAFFPSHGVAPAVVGAPLLLIAAEIGLSLVMVLTFLVLEGRDPDADTETAWVVLIGTALIGAGIAGLLGLSGVTVAFVAGVAIASITRGSEFLQRVGDRTERPVVLLLMLMAGLSLGYSPSAWLAAVLVFGLRVLARIAVGLFLGPWLGVSPLMGLGMLGAGGPSLAIAVQIELLFGGLVGEAALWTAALLMIGGDLAGPRSLRLLLRARGEIPPAAPLAPVDSPSVQEAPAR
jgi:hypothetical protein